MLRQLTHSLPMLYNILKNTNTLNNTYHSDAANSASWWHNINVVTDDAIVSSGIT